MKFMVYSTLFPQESILHSLFHNHQARNCIPKMKNTIQGNYVPLIGTIRE
jgi:hypothetical protein